MSNGASTDTAPIVTEIGRARADMAVAVENLADRVSPQKLKARVKMQISAKVADLKERLNPVRIIQRKLGRSGPAVGSGRRSVLEARTAEHKRLPAIR